MLLRIVQAFLYTIINTIAIVAAFLLAPVAVKYADDDGRLPKSFRWMETPDNPGWGGPLSEMETSNTFRNLGRDRALVQWLRRNKAYGLRMGLLSMPSDRKILEYKGKEYPPKWGFSYLLVVAQGGYFYFVPRISLGSFFFYLNCGWKLLNKGDTYGMFAGITPRTDDWDDYDNG